MAADEEEVFRNGEIVISSMLTQMYPAEFCEVSDLSDNEEDHGSDRGSPCVDVVIKKNPKPKPPGYCKVCKKWFKTERNLMIHSRQHNGSVFFLFFRNT